MWTFFNTMATSILDTKGILEDYLSNSFVPFLNIMQKAPEDFKTLQMPKGSPVEIAF